MQANAGSHSEASHLAAQVSQLSNQLHAAQAAAAAAQQEVHHLQSKHQVHPPRYQATVTVQDDYAACMGIVRGACLMTALWCIRIIPGLPHMGCRLHHVIVQFLRSVKTLLHVRLIAHAVGACTLWVLPCSHYQWLVASPCMTLRLGDFCSDVLQFKV